MVTLLKQTESVANLQVSPFFVFCFQRVFKCEICSKSLIKKIIILCFSGVMSLFTVNTNNHKKQIKEAIMKDEKTKTPANSSINDQEELLYINRFETDEIKDALPGFTVTPFFLDRENGIWVLYVKVAPGASVPTHFHTGPVHLYTTKGEWYYKEYPDDIQKEGTYLYEPGGSYHTLTSDKGAEFFNMVIGSNINFVDGEFLNIMDAGWIKEALEKATAEAGKEMPKYIEPGGGARYTK